jgi:hypothetical protein
MTFGPGKLGLFFTRKGEGGLGWRVVVKSEKIF